ncbi:MAG: alpha-galactosidase [Massilibacteroides sp.]|nr:alpha-galactosidase [Massilibacteroides sp.]
MKTIYTILLIIISPFSLLQASIKSCYAIFDADTLKIGNTLIERKFLWNAGNLQTYSITDKTNNQIWYNQNNIADFFVPKETEAATNGKWSVRDVESSIVSLHKEVVIEYSIGRLDVKRVYRIYPDCPAIAIDTYLKGSTPGSWSVHQKDLSSLKHIETLNILTQKDEIPVLDQISFSGKHWHIQSVEFFDITDYYNTLVRPVECLAYNENTCRGNLLFFNNLNLDKGLFFLKEAPCSGVQLAYPGADFITSPGGIKTIGLGLYSSDLRFDEWTKAYSIVTGVYAGGELERLVALRKYQKKVRSQQSSRDDMIMLNTWGDRGDLNRLTESFCLQEIEKCAKLGITHFQLDYGWSDGKDPGSYKNVYKNPFFWTPDKNLYPNGLKPLVDKGRELGVEICLFINPSFEYSYNDWEKDANSIINLYKTYGIRTYKIDGVLLTNKLSETRFRMMLDKILSETNNEVVFNLDVTAGQRGGYFYFNEYGNAFLENRYTDWGNYYPFWTLRNLWMLSKFVPAEKLQIEFLNKWRNQEKYGSDPFAPINYSFDYLFAITMSAQPLAWFDATGLPDDAFKIKKMISQYKDVQANFHKGIILPVGSEPSGKAWTGFQSIQGNEGYLLVYREYTPTNQGRIKTYLKENAEVEFVPLIGEGRRFKTRVSPEGEITLSLSHENSFVMYKYKIK